MRALTCLLPGVFQICFVLRERRGAASFAAASVELLKYLRIFSLSTTLISLADSAVAAAGVGGRHANCYSDQDPSTTTLIIIFPE